jgi:hypothetical protein
MYPEFSPRSLITNTGWFCPRQELNGIFYTRRKHCHTALAFRYYARDFVAFQKKQIQHLPFEFNPKQRFPRRVSIDATRRLSDLEGMMKRLIRRTVLALAVAFALGTIFSGSASAQYGDYDDYSYGSAQQAHQYGYQNGFHDGLRKGRHEGRENDPGDVDVRALRDATHGYRRWMGPVEAFQDGYRDGYRQGFRRGYHAANRGWRDRDYDDGYRY